MIWEWAVAKARGISILHDTYYVGIYNNNYSLSPRTGAYSIPKSFYKVIDS